MDKNTNITVGEKLNVAVGKKLSLECKGAIGREFECTWLHKVDKLPPEKYQGPDLTIMQMTEDHQGNYECHVANPFGEHILKVQIKVGKYDAPTP